MAYDRRTEEGDLLAAERERLDYEVEVGAHFVPVGVERSFGVLDEGRAQTLRAWVAAIIPARGSGPSAADVGAAEYIDAQALAAPRIRAQLLRGIDTADHLAMQQFGRSLAECGPDERAGVLRAFESADMTSSFAMVRDLTYEAYYANSRVLDALRDDTGWNYEGAVAGSELEPFDESLLDGMKRIQPRYRQA